MLSLSLNHFSDGTYAVSSRWGWGGWGSMITKATSSVSTMLETVENQLGIPSPLDMAKLATKDDVGGSKSDADEPKAQEKVNTFNIFSANCFSINQKLNFIEVIRNCR